MQIETNTHVIHVQSLLTQLLCAQNLFTQLVCVHTTFMCAHAHTCTAQLYNSENSEGLQAAWERAKHVVQQIYTAIQPIISLVQPQRTPLRSFQLTDLQTTKFSLAVSKDTSWNLLNMTTVFMCGVVGNVCVWVLQLTRHIIKHCLYTFVALSIVSYWMQPTFSMSHLINLHTWVASGSVQWPSGL